MLLPGQTKNSTISALLLLLLSKRTSWQSKQEILGQRLTLASRFLLHSRTKGDSRMLCEQLGELKHFSGSLV